MGVKLALGVALLGAGCGGSAEPLADADLLGIWVVSDTDGPLGARILRDEGTSGVPALILEEVIYDGTGAQSVRLGRWGLGGLDAVDEAANDLPTLYDIPYFDRLFLSFDTTNGGFPDVFGSDSLLLNDWEAVVEYDGDSLVLLTQWSPEPIRYERAEALP